MESSLVEEHAAGTNLDDIRDILFGAQVRDHERRFTKLEAQLLAEAAQLRNDLKERFASLEQYIRNEVDQVTGRLTAEEQSQSNVVGRLTTELQTLVGVLQRTAAQLREQSDQAHQDLRNQLHSPVCVTRRRLQPTTRRIVGCPRRSGPATLDPEYRSNLPCPTIPGTLAEALS